MEALWNLEDKWKLSTQEAVAFFACTAFLVIVLSLATVLIMRAKRRKSGLVHQDPLCINEEREEAKWPDHQNEIKNCGCVKKMLMRSVRWSGVSKSEEKRVTGSRRERAMPLLVPRRERCEDHLGRSSHNSSSAVWQRPILMGEKCELPRFSGLILYDERGRPVDQHENNGITDDLQENSSAAVRTMLRDFL